MTSRKRKTRSIISCFAASGDRRVSFLKLLASVPLVVFLVAVTSSDGVAFGVGTLSTAYRAAGVGNHSASLPPERQPKTARHRMLGSNDGIHTRRGGRSLERTDEGRLRALCLLLQARRSQDRYLLAVAANDSGIHESRSATSLRLAA